MPLGRQGDPFEQRVVAERYRLTRKLGHGGFGMVYQAEHVDLGRSFAIKFLHRQYEGDEQFLKRFQREARVTAQLNHPHIVAVTDYGTDEFLGHFFVMEYLLGETLSARLKRAGPMPSRQSVELMTAVAKAFAYAHAKGVIHRDVKSANVLLVNDESHQDHVKILDFGIARLAESIEREDAERLTHVGMLMGSASYMSPEQAQGFPVDSRADIYSLGVVLYEMVTGQVPFKADSTMELLNKQVREVPVPPSRTRPGLDVHPYVELIILKCLQKRPEERYQNADDLLKDLGNASHLISTGADIPLSVFQTSQALSRKLLEEGSLAPGLPQGAGARETTAERRAREGGARESTGQRRGGSAPGGGSRGGRVPGQTRLESVVAAVSRRPVPVWLVVAATAVVVLGVGVWTWLLMRARPRMAAPEPPVAAAAAAMTGVLPGPLARPEAEVAIGVGGAAADALEAPPEAGLVPGAGVTPEILEAPAEAVGDASAAVEVVPVETAAPELVPAPAPAESPKPKLVKPKPRPRPAPAAGGTTAPALHKKPQEPKAKVRWDEL